MSLEYIKTTPQYQKIINEIYTEKLDLGLTVNMAVSTNSMYPTIISGSIIEIKKFDEYKVGDVIILETSNGFLVHRIIKINKNAVVTKGDNNINEDECYQVADIRGKVIRVNGNNRGLYDYFNLAKNKIKNFFRFFFIKIKNLVFEYSNNFMVSYLLLAIYKIQILLIRNYFKIFESSNLYIRGSAAIGKLKPGLSDIDFVLLTKNDDESKFITKTLNLFSYISPVISFNSFLPMKIYSILRSAEMVEDYDSQYNIKKISGKLKKYDLGDRYSNHKLNEIHHTLELIDHVDDVIFKFSQMNHYHPSYLFHNIKKIFLKIFRENEWTDEFDEFVTFLNQSDRDKSLHRDLEEYAKALSLIIKKINIPDNELAPLALKELNKIKIKSKDVYLFQKIRNYKSYLLENDFDHKDLLAIIKYTVEENTYPFSSGVMTFEMANFFQSYYLNFILYNEFEYKEEILLKYLFDSIKFFNNYQIIKMKDRNTIQNTARDIVVLVNYLKTKKDVDYKLSTKLKHFEYELDNDQGLGANEIYLKYINELNTLFVSLFDDDEARK